MYKEFKSHNVDITNIPEVFRKEFGIHDMIPIPDDLDNLIDQ